MPAVSWERSWPPADLADCLNVPSDTYLFFLLAPPYALCRIGRRFFGAAAGRGPAAQCGRRRSGRDRLTFALRSAMLRPEGGEAPHDRFPPGPAYADRNGGMAVRFIRRFQP